MNQWWLLLYTFLCGFDFIPFASFGGCMVCMRLVPSEIWVEHHLLGKVDSRLILLLRGRAFESRLWLEKAVVEPVCRLGRSRAYPMPSTATLVSAPPASWTAYSPSFQSVWLVMGEAPARSQSLCNLSVGATVYVFHPDLLGWWVRFCFAFSPRCLDLRVLFCCWWTAL